MPLMAWNDRLSIGVTVLDADHKKLIEMINELYDSIIAGFTKKDLRDVLHRLADYTQFHFAREEELFFRIAYPNAAIHKREHHSMAVWVTGMQSRIGEGSVAGPSLEVVVYLKDWLFDHILNTDREFGTHLRSAGIQ